jgi:MFS family permease
MQQGEISVVEPRPSAGSEPPIPAAARSRRLLIGLYVAGGLLYWMALYLYVPTLPTYVQTRADDLALVGIVLAQYGLWQAIVRLPVGIASDWLGRRKPFILAGIALAGLGAWLLSSAQSTNGLIVGRAITGLAASTWVPLTVAFASLFSAQETIRATSILTFVASVGKIGATSVTGSLNNLGGYSLAFLLAAGAAALALLIILPAAEKYRPPAKPSVQSIAILVTRRDVLIPSLLAAVAQYANWAITFGFLPILARQLGASDVGLSLLVTMQIGLATVSSLVVAGIVHRISARHLVASTLALMSAGITLAAFAPSLAVVFVAQLLLGVAQGASTPLLMGMSIQGVADVERTTAMGLHQAVYAIGMFAGPWLSGILAEAVGLRPMFGATALGCLALGLLLFRLLPRTQAH